MTTPVDRQVEALRRAFDVSPEEWDRLCAAIEQITQHLGAVFAEVLRSAEAMTAPLCDAGVLPEEPPTDPRARALWLRQCRGTGPDRQVQHRPRPRRVP